jgi:hypothetical protein
MGVYHFYIFSNTSVHEVRTEYSYINEIEWHFK